MYSPYPNNTSWYCKNLIFGALLIPQIWQSRIAVHISMLRLKSLLEGCEKEAGAYGPNSLSCPRNSYLWISNGESTGNLQLLFSQLESTIHNLFQMAGAYGMSRFTCINVSVLFRRNYLIYCWRNKVSRMQYSLSVKLSLEFLCHCTVRSSHLQA